MEAWQEATAILGGKQQFLSHLPPPSGLLSSVAKLHSQGLDDVLLMWFFGKQRKAFAETSQKFRKLVENGAESPHTTVPSAVSMADECLRRSIMQGRVLSAAIHEARSQDIVHLGKEGPKDYTTDQLRAAFNVTLFDTPRPGSTLANSVSKVGFTERKRLSRSHTGELFATMASNYFRAVFREIHCTAGFKKGGSSSDSDSDDSEDSDDSQMGEAGDSNVELREGFAQVCTQLRSLRWIGRLEPALTAVLYDELVGTINGMCTGRHTRSLLPKLTDWRDRVALVWLRSLHEPVDKETERDAAVDDDDDDDADTSGFLPLPASPFESWKSNFELHLYQTFGSLRISELFSIIRSFPDSRPAILDLRECLKRTHQHRNVTTTLRRVFDARLLIPHAETPRILSIYIQTIKSLRLLDSTGVLLESVSNPIKSYLRGREDTIRKIVSDLTDPKGGELFRELHSNGTEAGVGGNRLLIQQDDDDDASEEEDDGNMMAASGAQKNGAEADSGARSDKVWMPDSLDADPTRSSRSRRLSDILSMLVQIYGSKKLFVTEYRRLLSQKLLKSASFKTDDEVMTLELLELRFGETPLHPCKIMMKDIDDSRRINKNIDVSVHQDKLDPAPMHATIISKEYWPKLLEEPSFKLHHMLDAAHKEFGRQFTKAKAPRKLIWKHNLGLVDLDLSFDTGVPGQPKKSFNFQCTPAQASIILHLRDEPKLSLRSLARKIGIQERLLRRIAAKWVNDGVIREVSSDGTAFFEVVENYAHGEDAASGTAGVAGSGVSKATSLKQNPGADDDDDEMLAQDRSALEQQALMYENYVRGMLSNFGELPLDRIHNMLSMFVPGDEGGISAQQLKSLLSHLCNQEKLTFDGSAYKLA